MANGTRKKIGRNERCPCGSGIKYKRCHGASNNPRISSALPESKIGEILARQQAQELQRKKQQGLGKPIISADMNGTRFVAVGNALYHSDKWKSFHDFLGHYITFIFGKDWGDSELQKPLEIRHPVCVWYHYICQLQRQHVIEVGKVNTAPMNGAAASWLHLAYDLYSLAHNAQVQTKLVNRLKNTDNFRGARYEVFVAGALIRAGFDIEFENEDDRSSTHCEFTATCRTTGKSFSVEAKQRNPDDQIGGRNGKFRLGRRLQKALIKAAKFPRIVFIDINVPDTATEAETPDFLNKALADIRSFEGRCLHNIPLPSAYIFVTNHPFEHNLEGVNFRCTALAEGFQIPEFKLDSLFPSIRAAYEARSAHSEMFQLLQSLREHSQVPSTFDGTPPEFAFGENPHRLIIGETYLVPDGNGNEIPGKLTTATVDTSKGVVYGAYSLIDGRSVIATNPLTEEELAVYKRHPEVFFGVPLPQGGKVESPLELFDFFHNSYRQTPKERLLELLNDSPDIELLADKSQEDLAFFYAERCAYSAINMASN